MNGIIDMMKRRRTIRIYRPEQIVDAELNAILDAGLHAPNAGGGQSAIIVACQNAALNEELGRLSRNAETNIGPNATPVSAEQPSPWVSVRASWVGPATPSPRSEARKSKRRGVLAMNTRPDCT